MIEKLESLESLEGRTWLGGEGNRHLKESNFSPLFDLSILLFVRLCVIADRSF